MSIDGPRTSHPFATSAAHEHERPMDASEEQVAWAIFGVLFLSLTLAYWNMITYTSTFWDDALYSHGWIVPLFAAYLFKLRLRRLNRVDSSEHWIGLAIITVCLLLRLVATYFDMVPLDRLSYVGALIGVCQLVGGFSMLKWAGPPVAFLVFMYPLPAALEHSILLKLQRLAAITSTLTLQLLGVPALRSGSRIMIDQLPLDVADACSGLRMSTIFGAMAVAVVLIIDRPWWDRFAILLSAIPIALVTNVIRITITALLYMWFPGNETVQILIHDWAGLAMMPIALGFLWLELQILTRITVPIESEDYGSFGSLAGT